MGVAVCTPTPGDTYPQGPLAQSRTEVDEDQPEDSDQVEESKIYQFMVGMSNIESGREKWGF